MDSTPPPKRHFADPDGTSSPLEHYFEQLNLDLDWAFGAVAERMEREQVDFNTAFEGFFRSIAGRRWNRFKEAEEAGNESRSKEMKAFAQLWYRLANEMGRLNPKSHQR